jgi:hypothetical protein
MTTSLSEAAVNAERALLGSLLMDQNLWPQAEGLSADDFGFSWHRSIFAQAASMYEDRRSVDAVTLLCEVERNKELERCGGARYISSLIDYALPENFSSYVGEVRRERRGRRIACLQKCIASTPPENVTELLELNRQLRELLNSQQTDEEAWGKLFHSYDEMISAPPSRFAIEGFLQEDGITLLGGLAGHGKTLCMLAIVRALLEGGKLFHHFAVNDPAQRVVYLIPEAGLRPFSARLNTFRLQEHVREKRLLFRTLSAPGELQLKDPRLLQAVKGADVFLDTAVRFMTGDENNATEQKLFADTLFGLQRAGARIIVGAHHSPKSFGKDSVMTLENVLRGSGDIGAMVCTCWGLRQIDDVLNRIFIQNVKARDFLPCKPFIIQGRPGIDCDGYFELTEPPGFAGELCDTRRSAGRPELQDKDQKRVEAQKMHDAGKGYREIAEALHVSVGIISSWLKRSKTVQ